MRWVVVGVTLLALLVGSLLVPWRRTVLFKVSQSGAYLAWGGQPAPPGEEFILVKRPASEWWRADGWDLLWRLESKDIGAHRIVQRIRHVCKAPIRRKKDTARVFAHRNAFVYKSAAHPQMVR